MMKKKYLSKEEIKAISGHRTDSAFNRYIKLDKDEVADEALRIFYGVDSEQHQPQQLQSFSVTSTPSSMVNIDYIERNVREKIELENKVKEQEERLGQQAKETAIIRKRMEQQSKELKDYQDTFTTAEYMDKVGDLAIQAEQDAIFLYHERP